MMECAQTKEIMSWLVNVIRQWIEGRRYTTTAKQTFNKRKRMRNLWLKLNSRFSFNPRPHQLFILYSVVEHHFPSQESLLFNTFIMKCSILFLQ
jgi:hypothetical protein